jgi:hypothetical protein
MGLCETVRQILRAQQAGMTPQQVRDKIKAEYPEYYGTESHRRNVDAGHYKDLDHALLAQIYIFAPKDKQILVDRSQKPMKLYPAPSPASEIIEADEELETENLERLEAGVGTMYVLGTHLYTKDGQEIIKIGITTGPVESRLNQLYNTSVPFRFRVIKQFDTKNFYALEQALHNLLEPYRINRSREFFTDKCLPFIDQIIAIHQGIQDNV